MVEQHRYGDHLRSRLDLADHGDRNALVSTNLRHPFTQCGDRDFTTDDDGGEDGVEAPQLNEHEIAILNPETQEWEVSEFAISESRHSPADLYLEGGYGWMTALTLCLIAMLFCTWKAPRWIKELGLLACTLGVLSMMIGFYSILQIIQTTGYSVTFTLLSGGLRVAFIAPIYGLIIYALSLLLRIAVKPRI